MLNSAISRLMRHATASWMAGLSQADVMSVRFGAEPRAEGVFS